MCDVRTILARVVALYTRLGIPLPAHRITGVGQIPEDCEQVAVSLIGMTRSAPGESPAFAPCTQPITLETTVAITRCAPLGVEYPSTQSADDAYILLAHACEFTPLEGSRAQVSVDINDPSGGMQTTVLTLHTLLDGDCSHAP
jgi:hypothetical protein